MDYQFLIDTYRTEIEKVLGVWSMFDDEDLLVRPNATDRRGRNLLEQMVHQCISEDLWFSTMLGIEVTDSPLPQNEARLEFIRAYHRDATARLSALAEKPGEWWPEIGHFFDERRSHAWIVVRRIAHTAHHRGQQTTLLRILNHDLHSTYGPTADTGGLMQNHAPVIYPYEDADGLIREESEGRRKFTLPKLGRFPVTERPTRPSGSLKLAK